MLLSINTLINVACTSSRALRILLLAYQPFSEWAQQEGNTHYLKTMFTRMERDYHGNYTFKLPGGEWHRGDRDRRGKQLPALVQPNRGCARFAWRNVQWRHYPVRAWCVDDRFHRDDNDGNEAAVTCHDGSEGWFTHGKADRTETHLLEGSNRRVTYPAIIEYDPLREHKWVSAEWWQKGIRHRSDVDENGHALPSIVLEWGKHVYYDRGELSRTDRDPSGNLLPAVVFIHLPGSNQWWVGGQRVDRICCSLL